MLLTGHDEGSPQTFHSPFAEAEPIRAEAVPVGFADAGEAFSPFAVEVQGEQDENETDRMIGEALAELRDEAFDEAVAFLAEETEAAVADRFADEAPGHGVERERFADLQLSTVRYEAERYLDALEAGFQGLDVNGMSEVQLGGKLDQFDPQPAGLSPAGEEFIGGLVRKAKKAVKFVANAAKSVGKLAMPLLGPVLGKLKALVRPLLRRVLAIAIGRLPVPLRPAAKLLAGKIGLEAEMAYEDGESVMSPANLTDLESVTAQFDEALAEAALGGGTAELEQEDEGGWNGEAIEGRELERLAEARGALIDALASGDEAAVQPAVEQFVPVLLGALKLGINLVGRPKVVGFLAGYLGKLIGRWVGPKLAGPLSNAIVDTGMRLISLEAEDGTDGRAGTLALASVVEDTVRRLAEREDYVFESEDLTQIAVAEAFGQAVATRFPAQYVRPDLRQAASLGGTFVARRPRSPRSYSKYSRVPEIEVTPQIADAIPTFGGTTLGSALRAAGVTLPVRARLHLYQASPGSTISTITRTDRTLGGAVSAMPPSALFHPLSPTAAGLLLREPRLGVRAPAAFLQSRRRLGAGQRVYALQPLGAAAIGAGASSASLRAATARLAPTRTRVAFDRPRKRLALSLYFSEAEAQRVAQAIREGRGHAPLLQALVEAWRLADGSTDRAPILREDEDETEAEELAPGNGRAMRRGRGRMLRQLRRWAIPALAAWARHNAESFARAAADPASGVTVRLRIGPVSGLDGIDRSGGSIRGAATAPAVAVGVAAGFQRP